MSDKFRENKPEFQESPKMLKGRLGFKGSMTPDVVRGFLITDSFLLQGKKGSQRGNLPNLFYKSRMEGKVKEPGILAVNGAFDFSQYSTSHPENFPLVGIITSGGIMAHGFTVMRDSIETQYKMRNLIGIGAVADLEILENGEEVEIDASDPENVLIKVISGHETH